MNVERFNKFSGKGRLEEMVRKADSLRYNPDKPIDVSFADMVKDTFTMSLDTFYYELGIDPNFDTVQNLVTMPELDVRWIIPEIYREALMLGYRAAPIWPNVIAAEENTSGLSQIMPFINMSDAAPRKVGEGETIPLGTLSYGSKKFTIYKVGRGISLTYEVLQYASLNVVSLFLADFGTKLGQAFDTLAIDCLINGDQADGSESSPVIGIITPNTKVYKDFLRVWIRMARLGRTMNTIIGGEESALYTLDMDEFKLKSSGSTYANLNLKTPVPKSADYYIHGNIPDHQEILLDPSRAMIKFNAQPLMVESEKIVSNQTNAFYATITAGFARMFRDAALIMDDTLNISAAPFPSYMDVDPYQLVDIK
jgi:hypothetical protein